MREVITALYNAPHLIGQTLSQFNVTAKLGEGGMGAVYRAEDTKLGREVAIKVLPEAFTADPERLARFQREAKVLASLNHPNIAAIYDLAAADDVHFLVLELVEGQDLAERLALGRLSVEETLPLAIQIAEALEAAHDRGIVHRDLKPANIKLTPEGQIKVLDFGLAKAWETDQENPNMTQSPTLTAQMTRAGVILGTAAYMSPEQARGLEADQRSDIWSFGVVLYELLTGRQGFRGDTVSDTLASILKDDLDLEALPSDTPRQVIRVLQRCLDKNPKERLHSIADARLELRDAIDAPIPRSGDSSESRRSTLFGWPGLVGAVLVGAALTYALVPLASGPASATLPGVVHASVPLPPEIEWIVRPQISEDGSLLVFVANGGSGTSALYARRLDELELHEIPGTVGASDPFLSPDGHSVGFFDEGKLKAVSLSGGDPIVLADVPASSPGKALWLRDGKILFTPRWTGSGLHEVPSAGGEPRVLTEPDREAGELGHWWPRSLPGEKTILFTIWRAAGGLNHSKVAALDLETGEQKILFDGASARYLPTGHLLYFHRGRWLVVPFDPDRVEAVGEAVPVLEGAARLHPRGAAEDQVSVAMNGTLVYRPHAPLDRISWFDGEGHETPWPFEPRFLTSLVLSPDGSRLAVTVREAGTSRIWIMDPKLGVEERFVAGEGSYFGPVWHPDGDQLAFTALETGDFNVLVKGAASATPSALVTTEGDQWAAEWSSDGGRLIYVGQDEIGLKQIWMLDVESPEDKVAITSGSTQSFGSRLSPDDRWLSYVSRESGRAEVYVQSFPAGASRIKVSRGGGIGAIWSADGRTLYYTWGGDIYAASLSTLGDRLVVEDVRQVLELPAGWTDYDVAPDGRIVAIVPVRPATPELRLITNWTSQLNELAPPSE